MACLTVFLQEEAGRAFAWGQEDCADLARRWAAARSGSDIARHQLQLRDAPPAGARALTGMARAFRKTMRGLGWHAVAAPAAGDIALCRWRDLLVFAVAVDAVRFAARSACGLAVVPMRPLLLFRAP